MVKNQSKPLVSVVITNYNYAKFIGEAIESVLGQTYGNLNLIIINDGSTDNSLEVINEYKDNKKIQIVTRENRGVVYTRNQGIEMATGEFLCFLDADDYMDKNYIERTVKVALEKESDLIYTDFQMFEASDERSSFPEYNFERLKNQNFIHISCLIRKEAIGDTRFDEYLSGKSHEDWDFFISLGLKNIKFTKCGEVVLFYRIHGSGRNNHLNNVRERFEYLDIYQYIINKHIAAGDVGFDYLQALVVGGWFQDLYKETEEKTKSLEEQNLNLIAYIDAVEQSRSYRVGRLVVSPVRKLKEIMENIKNHYFQG